MKINTTSSTNSSGFSLAKLMVLIVITGLLAALLVSNSMQKHRAQVETAKTEITALSSALNEFASNNANRYPDSLDILVVLDENGFSYLNTRTLPNDPWGNPYVYEPPTPGESRPRVISYAKDGQPGGETTGRDLDSWPDND